MYVTSDRCELFILQYIFIKTNQLNQLIQLIRILSKDCNIAI
jgi:hypothetical protein